MTLLELVKKYRGTAKFNVDGIIDDAREDLVVFMNSEYDAIKDEIINGEVTRYNISAFASNVPTIDVVVKLKTEDEQPDTPATPSTPDTPASGEDTGDTESPAE